MVNSSKGASVLALLAMGSATRGFAQASVAAPKAAAVQSADAHAAPTTTLHVSAKLVVLDVTVQDRQGHPVLSLGKDDFTILDNGVPQRIRSFEPPSAHVLPKVASDKVSLDKSSLTILLYDELNTGFEEATQTRDALENYLKAQPPVMAQPTMLIALNDAGYQMLSTYTQSPAELLAALKAHKVSLPSSLMRSDSELRLADTFSALRQLANATRGVGQRKNVIWIGNGFPSVNVELIDPAGREKLMNAVQDLTDVLLEARISVSKIDPRANTSAVSDPFDDADSPFVEGFDPYETSLTFNNFVKQTGGIYVFGRNDFETAIDEITQTGSAYYTISYTPVSAGDADTAYHQIDVRLDRPNIAATTRQGYYASTNEPELSEDQKALVMLGSAANDVTPYAALGVRIPEFEYGSDSNTGATLADCTIAVDGDGLRWGLKGGGDESADLLVAIASFSKQGKMLSYSVRRLSLDVNKDVLGQKAIDHPAFRLYTPVPQAAARLRFLVTQEGTGRLGSYDMAVPRR